MAYRLSRETFRNKKPAFNVRASLFHGAWPAFSSGVRHRQFQNQNQ